MCVLWGAIILNDLAKLFRLCIEETSDLLKERRERNEIEREKEREQVNIVLEEDDEIYFQNLEEKLDKFHLQLLRASAARNSMPINGS